jgi:hypothetical protein
VSLATLQGKACNKNPPDMGRQFFLLDLDHPMISQQRKETLVCS